MNLVVSAGPAAPPGLVAAFGFEEATGDDRDRLGERARSTARSGRRVRVATGKIGKALSFDGVNDWVTVTERPAARST